VVRTPLKIKVTATVMRRKRATTIEKGGEGPWRNARVVSRLNGREHFG
jgi:hypothetical protein